MRKPKQVLIFLYRKNKKDEYEYCVFYRKKKQIWQAISGGVEDDETLIETVKREVFEETNIETNNIFQLSSVCSIPVINITGKFTWGNDVYVVTEYSFGVFTKNSSIKLSSEHNYYEWLPFDEACRKLEFDSNKTALWELNQRLLNSDLK